MGRGKERYESEKVEWGLGLASEVQVREGA
jgi:hypothetical protein